MPPMTLTTDQSRRGTPSSRPLVVAAGVFVLLAMLAYVVGTSQPRVRTAEVECLSAPGAISCEMADGWMLGVPTDVAWTSGSHDRLDGRPACLPPTGRGLEGPVEVSWVPVEVHGRSWRQVVHVACLE